MLRKYAPIGNPCLENGFRATLVQMFSKHGTPIPHISLNLVVKNSIFRLFKEENSTLCILEKKMRRFSFAYIFLSVLCVFAFFCFSSCYTPSPLYGTWADNDGNKISFVSDGTFVAKVNDSDSNLITYEGSYNVIDNVIVFSTSDGLAVNTEWDIRGSVLYLTWTAAGTTKNLSLYHTSK